MKRKLIDELFILPIGAVFLIPLVVVTMIVELEWVKIITSALIAILVIILFLAGVYSVLKDSIEERYKRDKAVEELIDLAKEITKL